jgi:hypothetical protein
MTKNSFQKLQTVINSNEQSYEQGVRFSFCCTFASGISSALDYYMFSYCTLKGNDEACPRGQAFFIYARMLCRRLIIFSS